MAGEGTSDSPLLTDEELENLEQTALLLFNRPNLIGTTPIEPDNSNWLALGGMAFDEPEADLFEPFQAVADDVLVLDEPNIAAWFALSGMAGDEPEEDLTVPFQPVFDVVSGSVFSYTGTGGIVVSGVAGLTKGKDLIASGGLISGGAASLTKSKSAVVSGGALLGGSATFAKGKSAAASGGATLGGAASLVKAKAATVSGGASFGGAATSVKVKATSATGGAVIAGAATTQYIAASGPVVFSYTGSGGLNVLGIGYTETTVPADNGARGGSDFVYVNKKKPKPKAFTYQVTDLGRSFGGSAVTQWNPNPLQVHEYLSSARFSIAGIAATTHYNHGNTIRRMDAEFLELLEIRS